MKINNVRTNFFFFFLIEQEFGMQKLQHAIL